MTVDKCIAYLEDMNKFGIDLGLQRMEELLAYMDNPHKGLACIHVAGTNGKGSITNMLQSVLRKSGLKVGLFNSPHLLDYREYFRVDNSYISDEDFVTYVERLKKAIQNMVDQGGYHPTQFEAITAMMFLYLKEKNVDIAVIEVGLGGRLDSTNVIENPLLSIISTIDLDHTHILGDTLEAISFEKAGIIKEGCPVITSNTDKKVIGVLEEVALRTKAPFYQVNSSAYRIIENGKQGNRISIGKEEYNLALPGKVQCMNAALVIYGLEVLRDTYGYVLEPDTIRQGLGTVAVLGRIETKDYKGQTYIFDGCHNNSSVDNLVDHMETQYSKQQLVLVSAMLKDKNYEENLIKLIALTDAQILTEIPNTPRQLTVEKMKEVMSNKLEKKSHVLFIKDISDALREAQKIAGNDKIILVAGSFYLVAATKKYLEKAI